MRNKILASVLIASTTLMGNFCLASAGLLQQKHATIEPIELLQLRLADENQTTPDRPRLADENQTTPDRPRVALV